MSRPTSPMLTEGELRLMKILWERGPSTVGDVAEALLKEVSLAPSTVRTTLGILEEKGYVESTLRGRAKVFHAIVDRGEARGSVARYVIDRFFNGSAQELVLKVIKDEALGEEELSRLRQLIQERE